MTKLITKKSLPLILTAALLVILTACAGGSGSASNVIKQGQSLTIPLKDLTGDVSFYPVSVDNVVMEVVAVKAPDGSIRTAFNTCQVCNGSPLAYFVQKGDVLECQNCGNRYPMTRVGVEAGGCNPVPITDADRSVTGDSVLVPYDVLASAKRLFAVWKK